MKLKQIFTLKEGPFADKAAEIEGEVERAYDAVRSAADNKDPIAIEAILTYLNDQYPSEFKNAVKNL